MTVLSLPRMLRCLRTARALQAHLDGETDEPTSRQVTAHLAECRRCGTEAAAYRAVKQALRSSGGDADALAVRRLRAFSRQLSD